MLVLNLIFSRLSAVIVWDCGELEGVCVSLVVLSWYLWFLFVLLFNAGFLIVDLL